MSCDGTGPSRARWGYFLTHEMYLSELHQWVASMPALQVRAYTPEVLPVFPSHNNTPSSAHCQCIRDQARRHFPTDAHLPSRSSSAPAPYSPDSHFSSRPFPSGCPVRPVPTRCLSWNGSIPSAPHQPFAGKQPGRLIGQAIPPINYLHIRCVQWAAVKPDPR